MATPAKNTPSITPTSASTLLAGRDVNDLIFNPGLPDVRGWDVKAQGSTKIGTVDRILFDKHEKKPRYLAVVLPGNQGHLLLPIGLCNAKLDTRWISVDALKPDMLRSLPTLTQELVTVDFERQVVKAVAGQQASLGAPSQWYTLPAFDVGRFLAAPSKVVT